MYRESAILDGPRKMEKIYTQRRLQGSKTTENINRNLFVFIFLVVLKESVDNATTHPKELTQVMKCLRYIFKFVVRSRELFSDCNDGKGQEPFEELLKDVLKSLAKLMFYKSDDLYGAQSNCLKHMILALPDLKKVYKEVDLAEIVIQMINGLPDRQLNESKVTTIRDIVHCPLFENPQCREILLPAMATHVRDMMTSASQPRMITLVSDTMGDILDKLSSLSPR